jgi:hypothetical protein
VKTNVSWEFGILNLLLFSWIKNPIISIGIVESKIDDLDLLEERPKRENSIQTVHFSSRGQNWNNSPIQFGITAHFESLNINLVCLDDDMISVRIAFFELV